MSAHGELEPSSKERSGCRLGFLSWFWSAGAWASLFLALAGWVACVGLVLGVPNGIDRWFQWCGTWVTDVPSFFFAGLFTIIVLFTYIGVIMVGFFVAMGSHAIGVISGTGTVLMPGASPWARLSGVFPLGAHIGGALIGLYLLLFTGPNDPANLPPPGSAAHEAQVDGDEWDAAWDDATREPTQPTGEDEGTEAGEGPD